MRLERPAREERPEAGVRPAARLEEHLPRPRARERHAEDEGDAAPARRPTSRRASPGEAQRAAASRASRAARLELVLESVGEDALRGPLGGRRRARGARAPGPHRGRPAGRAPRNPRGPARPRARLREPMRPSRSCAASSSCCFPVSRPLRSFSGAPPSTRSADRRASSRCSAAAESGVASSWRNERQARNVASRRAWSKLLGRGRTSSGRAGFAWIAPGATPGPL